MPPETVLRVVHEWLVAEERGGSSVSDTPMAAIAIEHGVTRTFAGDSERFGWKPKQWFYAMCPCRQTVSLPLSPKLADADVGRVIMAVTDLSSHRA